MTAQTPRALGSASAPAARPLSSLDTAPIRADLDAVESAMRRHAAGQRLDRAGVMVQEHLATGGKRLRARLALAACTARGRAPGMEAVELLTMQRSSTTTSRMATVCTGQPTTWSVRRRAGDQRRRPDAHAAVHRIAQGVPAAIQGRLSACLAAQAATTSAARPTNSTCSRPD